MGERNEEPVEGQEDTFKDKVRIAVRMPPAMHDALRIIAFERRVSLNTLAKEGLAAVLQKHGR